MESDTGWTSPSNVIGADTDLYDQQQVSGRRYDLDDNDVDEDNITIMVIDFTTTMFLPATDRTN